MIPEMRPIEGSKRMNTREMLLFSGMSFVANLQTRIDNVEVDSTARSRHRALFDMENILRTVFATMCVFAIVHTCSAMEPQKVVVPEKAKVEFWDRNKLIGSSEYPVGQMYYDGGGINSSSAWSSLAGKVKYDAGPGIPTISSPYSDDEPTYGTKRTHHFFNGWKSDGKIIHSYDIVDPSVTRLESSWVEVDGEKTYYSVGGSIVARGLSTGKGPSYNPENVAVQSMSAHATLYRGSVDYSGDIDKDALDDFLAAQDDGDAGDVVIWLSGSVSCYRYRKDIQTDGNGNVVNVMYDWKDAVEYHPDGPCTFDVGLVVTTASGHQWDRIELGSVTISSGFYGFNDSSSAGFKIRHTLSKSLFTRGESYKLTYEFNRSHSLRTSTYPSTTSIVLNTEFPDTVVGSGRVGRFDVWVDSADAAVGSLTLKWNPPEFRELRTWNPLGKAKTDRILSGVTYSIYRSRGNENWTDVAKINVNDTTKDGSDEFVRDLECVKDSCSGTTFTDTTFGTLGGNKPIHYIVVLNGGPMDARRNDTLPFLYGTAFGKVIARHRHSISLGLSKYDTKSDTSEWKPDPITKKDRITPIPEARYHTSLFKELVSTGYVDADNDKPMHYHITDGNCKTNLVNGYEEYSEGCRTHHDGYFEAMAKDPRLKPGDDVFFFIFTHGSVEGLALYDGLWKKQEIKDCIGKFKGKGVRFIGVIEACHSGAIAKEFESNDFGFTTWVAAAKSNEISCGFAMDSWTGHCLDGFGRVFLENGGFNGYGKLPKVFSRYDRLQDTGATDNDTYLTLATLANYTDLIWTGFSTKILTDSISRTRSSCEQHIERVRPGMLEHIVLSSVIKEELVSVESSVPTLTSFSSGTRPDATVNVGKPIEQTIAGLVGVKIEGVPSHTIYKLRYNSGIDDWCVGKTWNDSSNYLFFTPYQFRVLFGAVFAKDGSVSFLKSEREKEYKYHFLEPGRAYTVHCRTLTPSGWGLESNSVELRMPRNEEWYAAQVKDDRIRAQAEVLLRGWGNRKALHAEMTNTKNLLGSGSGWQNEIPEDVTLRLSVGITKTSDGLRANFRVWTPSYNYDWDGFTVNGEWGYDPPPAVVVLDEKNGVATCDFGEVTGHLVYHDGDYDDYDEDYDDYYEDYNDPINIDGRLVLTISTTGFTGKWGTLEFSGNVYIDTSDVENMDQLRKEYFPFVLPEGDDAAPKDWCAVTFMPNGGCGLMEDQIISIGESVALVSNRYSNVDCEFLGWATSPIGDVVYVDGQCIMPNEDLTLYAKWKYTGILSFTVMFDVNGGTSIDEHYKFVDDGASLGKLPTPQWDGHEFLGWFTEPVDGIQITGETEIRKDVTYYAHWVYTVTFDPQIYHWDGDQGMEIEKPIIRQVASGQPIGALPMLTWDDEYVPGWSHVFLGWFTMAGNDEEISESTIVTSDIIYYAHWDYVYGTTQTCKVTFNANGGTVSPMTRTVTSGATLGTLPTPTLEKYKFIGWFTEVDGGMKVTTSTKVTEDVTYYAHWEYDGSVVVAAEVAEDCEGMGTVSGGGKAVKAGTKVTLKATAKKGNVFVEWRDDKGVAVSQSVSYTYVAVDEDVTLTAVFATTAADEESLKVAVEDVATGEDGTIGTVGADGTWSLDLGAYVESLSLPKLAVSGLPAGLKYDAKTMKVTGKATKPGVYTVKVTASNASATGKKAVVETFNITVPNFRWNEETVGVALEDKYLLQAGVTPALSDEVAAITGAGWKLAVSGLPSGVKFDVYTVYFTATRGKGKTAEKEVATATFEVVFPTLALSMAAWGEASATNKCKVAGGGKYPFGKKVTVKATANKGSVFMGWYDGEGELVAQTASYSYVTTAEDVTFTAMFVTAAEDKASIALGVNGEERSGAARPLSW